MPQQISASSTPTDVSSNASRDDFHVTVSGVLLIFEELGLDGPPSVEG